MMRYKEFTECQKVLERLYECSERGDCSECPHFEHCKKNENADETLQAMELLLRDYAEVSAGATRVYSMMKEAEERYLNASEPDTYSVEREYYQGIYEGLKMAYRSMLDGGEK